MRDGSVAVIVPAAGLGRRMGNVRKQYLELDGEPVLMRTLRAFLDHPRVRWIVVALPAADVDDPPEWLSGLDPRVTLVAGGAERTDSVRHALERVPAEADIVAVHDAARPLVTRAVIDRALDAVSETQGAVAAIPIVDTVKLVDAAGVIEHTPDRGRLWRAQTPQAFPRAMLAAAHEAAVRAGGVPATDDAALVERNGGRVVVVEGDAENLKVTESADVIVAETVLERRRMMGR